MDMKVISSKNGELNIIINGILMHSSYNPSEESKTIIKHYEYLFKDKVIHIFGLGLGYHVNELCKYIGDNQTIKVFESNKELIKIFNEIEIFSFKSNVNIYDESAIAGFASTLNSANDLIVHNPSLKVCGDKDLKSVIKNFKIARDSVQENSILLKENYEANLKQNCRKINELFKIKSKDVKVVASAGPSLDSCLDLLQSNRMMFDVFCVGSALRAIMKRSIIPNCITIIDGQEIVKNQLNGFESLDVPLCFLSTASRWAVEAFKGPKYIFYNDPKEKECSITTGKTVAIATIDIAIKCGAKTIILVGQDLAYINNRSHSLTFEEIYDKENIIQTLENTLKVKSVNGNMLYTNSGYMLFKKGIETLIQNNPKVKFYNCSSGAFINGAINKNLDEVLQELVIN